MSYKPSENLVGTKTLVKIRDLNHDGEGVGRLENLVTFVPGALPGEEVKIEIVEQRKNYLRAQLIEITTTSPDRITPPCSYFYTCGGCQLQHLAYQAQLAWKRSQVKAALFRIGKLEFPVLPTIGMANPYRYRNKGRFHLAVEKDKLLVGFFAQQSHDLININDCLIQHPINIEALTALRQAIEVCRGQGKTTFDNLAFFYDAELRTSFFTGQVVITLDCRQDRPDSAFLELINAELKNTLGHRLAGLVIKTPGKSGNTYQVVSGSKWIEEQIGFYRYRISPQSFFQVNPVQAGELFKLTSAYAGKPQTAIDLYCGTGNFSMHLSQVAQQVIGIDSEESAIADARFNASLNGIKNTRFVVGRVEQIADLLKEGADPKTIILDPPRKGCSPELLQSVADAKPDRIVYVSCNPATLARDLKLLHSKGYPPLKIQPVDMFPQTSHVETVALLSRNADADEARTRD